MSVYVIRPSDGWHAGDRAYCTRGSRTTTPSLEVGKVYTVANVKNFNNMVECSLKLDGVALPKGYRGISSARFVKLRPGQTSMAQIEQATTRGWLEAYYASTGRRADGSLVGRVAA